MGSIRVVGTLLVVLLVAGLMGAAVDTIRVEAAIALARAGKPLPAVAMLQPLANAPHAPAASQRIRELITHIEAGESIAQPMGRVEETPEDPDAASGP